MTWLTGKVSAYIGGGMLVVMLGLAIALTITRGTLHDRTQQLATAKATLAAESNAHQVTIQSLDQCNAQLASKSAESDRRAAAYDQSKADDAANNKDADARQRADKGRRDTLKQIAANSPDSGCRAPAALTDSLRGL